MQQIDILNKEYSIPKSAGYALAQLTHLPQIEGKIQQNDRKEHGKTSTIREVKKSIFAKGHVVKPPPLLQ